MQTIKDLVLNIINGTIVLVLAVLAVFTVLSIVAIPTLFLVTMYMTYGALYTGIGCFVYLLVISVIIQIIFSEPEEPTKEIVEESVVSS